MWSSSAESSDASQGLFAADTRVLSSYRCAIEGQPWDMLGRWHEGHESAHWQFQNRPGDWTDERC